MVFPLPDQLTRDTVRHDNHFFNGEKKLGVEIRTYPFPVEKNSLITNIWVTE